MGRTSSKMSGGSNSKSGSGGGAFDRGIKQANKTGDATKMKNLLDGAPMGTTVVLKDGTDQISYQKTGKVTWAYARFDDGMLTYSSSISANTMASSIANTTGWKISTKYGVG